MACWAGIEPNKPATAKLANGYSAPFSASDALWISPFAVTRDVVTRDEKVVDWFCRYVQLPAAQKGDYTDTHFPVQAKQWHKFLVSSPPSVPIQHHSINFQHLFRSQRSLYFAFYRSTRFLCLPSDGFEPGLSRCTKSRSLKKHPLSSDRATNPPLGLSLKPIISFSHQHFLLQQNRETPQTSGAVRSQQFNEHKVLRSKDNEIAALRY